MEATNKFWPMTQVDPSTSRPAKSQSNWKLNEPSDVEEGCAASPPESSRPPMLGQVGELVGLRLSQYLGSRAESGELNEASSPKLENPIESGATHVRSRSSTTDDKSCRLGRQSSAGKFFIINCL